MSKSIHLPPAAGYAALVLLELDPAKLIQLKMRGAKDIKKSHCSSSHHSRTKFLLSYDEDADFHCWNLKQPKNPIHIDYKLAFLFCMYNVILIWYVKFGKFNSMVK